VCLSTDRDSRRVMEREGGALSELRKSGSRDAMRSPGIGCRGRRARSAGRGQGEGWVLCQLAWEGK
jgi:hypothetical protein